MLNINSLIRFSNNEHQQRLQLINTELESLESQGKTLNVEKANLSAQLSMAQTRQQTVENEEDELRQNWAQLSWQKLTCQKALADVQLTAFDTVNKINQQIAADSIKLSDIQMLQQQLQVIAQNQQGSNEQYISLEKQQASLQSVNLI